MLPDQQLLTAPLSVCVSASHLKSLLSSEKTNKNRNIKQALMGVLEPSGCFTPGWNIQKFTFLGLQSVSVPRCANTPRLVSEVVSWSSLSPISVTSEPRDNTWSALSSLTGLKDWIQRRTKTLFQPWIMLKCYSCLTQLYEFLRVGDSSSCSLFFLLFSFKLICHSFKKKKHTKKQEISDIM